VKEYVEEGMSEKDAEEAAGENLVMTTVPMLPADGDLTSENPELIPMKTMGGVNGYGISAYTKCPNACLEFVKFATDYEMVMKRAQMLGIAPAREDAAKDSGTTSQLLFDQLSKGNIVLMPSCSEVSQIWTPGQTFFSDVAKDAFRPESDMIYKTPEDMKAGLEVVEKQIHDAIYTLK
jgi:arabinogalactan oligomer/maltooligosaccharide transport system substrate-binding protein